MPLDKATDYAAEDADVTLRLWMRLKPRLAAERMPTVYETLERPLPPVLARHGARRHPRRPRRSCAAVQRRSRMRMARLEAEAHRLAGHQFNLGSPKQIGELLFDKLGCPAARKTKTGQWETRAGLLEDLAASEGCPTAPPLITSCSTGGSSPS